MRSVILRFALSRFGPSVGIFLAVGCGKLLELDGLTFHDPETGGGTGSGAAASGGSPPTAGASAGGTVGRPGGATGYGGEDGSEGGDGAGMDSGGMGAGMAGTGARAGGSGGAGAAGRLGGGAGSGVAGVGGAEAGGGSGGSAGAAGGGGGGGIVHVSPSGVDGSTCGSEEAPCRTVQAGFDRAPPNGVIQVAPGVYDENPIQFHRSVTIVGAGIDTTTIRGNHPSSSTLYSSVPIDLTLRNLTVSGPARGLLSGATVLLEDVRFSDITRGRAIHSSGSLTLRRCSLVDNTGTAVWSDSAVVIEDTLVADNTASEGPIVYHGGGSVTVRRSAFVRNTSSSGSATFDVALGTRADLTNVTFAENSADWVLTVSSIGFLDLRFCTIAHNDMLLGAVATFSIATADVLGSLLADNGPRNCSGAIDSRGYNLSSDDTCSSFVEAGDLQNVSTAAGVLSNNGGPTPTCPLLPGSPAIDAADTLECPATDQRGVTRPQTVSTAACDIGAFEREP